MPHVIHAKGPATAAVEIHISGEVFGDPWRLVVRRPGREPHHAECTVFADREPDGTPHLRVVWKGEPHASGMQGILSRAVSARIEEALPPGAVLEPFPGGTD